MLLVPDYVLAWAVRQWLVANEISKKTGKLLTFTYLIVYVTALSAGWSKTHAFFIIMGGFHLFEYTRGRNDYGKPRHPLTEADVIQLFGKEIIEFPADVETKDEHPAVEIKDDENPVVVEAKGSKNSAAEIKGDENSVVVKIKENPGAAKTKFANAKSRQTTARF